MEIKAAIFEFTSYKFEPAKKRILFNYRTEFKGKKPLFFTEIIILPKIPNLSYIDKRLVDKLLEGAHIILGVSYYKLYCATKIKTPYRLSKKEADFWNIVYKNGLAEFFYKNKLNPNIFPKFPYKKTDTVSYDIEKNDKCLIGIGGGKDSIVTAELLKQNKFNITGFIVETNKRSKLIDGIVKKIPTKSIRIKRILDEKIYHQHQYNGHIPISAIYAFLGILTSVLYQYSYFIVSNEYSSNFGNLRYKGKIINHQWSKSFEFERLFQDYIKNFITPNINYFSLLRPFYEIRIVRMFSKLRKYFSVFSSCNSNFKTKGQKNKGLWCCNCPKCIFVFTLLSAFLSKKDLLTIFGKNLYEDEDLLPLFKDILGFGKIKPFDCVGTFEEAKSALYLAKNKFRDDFIMRQLALKVKFNKKVFKINNQSNTPEQFKLLGVETVLILGYGKEGQTTKKYLKKYHPNLKIGVADEKQGKNYLKKQNEFDIAIKTPGIRKELIKIPYTTATNIFFSKVLGKNIVIGITGSKGKSTTSSLIFEILKMAGKNVTLLGNIGDPMLEILLNPVKKNQIFVLELSSYQLDDIKFSPDIAVVTNLFPEHMDYHGNIKNYYQAKKNIINSQSKNDFIVYNPENGEVVRWLKNYIGKAIPFSKNIPLEDGEIPLIGEHNKDNIKAAVSVARILNISDKKIKKAIKNFKGLPHRLELVGQFKGITFYNDGSSTNPESAILAIKALKNIDTIFLGGEERRFVFSELEKTIKNHHIKNIALFPNNGDKMIKNKKGLNILKTRHMAEAVAFAYKHTQKGKICLLSGGSPSYSLWKNFEEKGKQFRLLVKKIAKDKSDTKYEKHTNIRKR